MTHPTEPLPVMAFDPAKYREEQVRRKAAERLAEELQNEVEQLRVQLAGCSVAACGCDWNERALQGDYGWSVAYADVSRLKERYDDALRQLGSLEAERDQLRENLRTVIDQNEAHAAHLYRRAVVAEAAVEDAERRMAEVADSVADDETWTTWKVRDDGSMEEVSSDRTITVYPPGCAPKSEPLFDIIHLDYSDYSEDKLLAFVRQGRDVLVVAPRRTT